MRAGPLDRRIVIQSRTMTQNASGAMVESWGTFATVWAQKTDLRGDEFFAARGTHAEVTTRFRIRNLGGLKHEMRISHDGNTYDILGIAELGRGDGFEIMARLLAE